MGTHCENMRVLLQLILPLLLQGKSIIKERNEVIKQALIPTLVNIIGHARMQEHGIGDDMDGLLNFMDEEKVLDPFLSWLGWFTNLVIDKEEGKSEEDSEESKSIIAERNDVIKQALIPTLVNIIRHARMQEHGPKIDDILDYIDEQKILDPFLQWLAWFSDMILTNEEGGGEKDDDLTQSDEEGLELEVLEKEESMEERMKKMEEEEDHAAIPQEDDEKAFEEEVLKKEESLENRLKEEISNQENEDKPSGNGEQEEIYEASGQETKREIYDNNGSEENLEEIYDVASAEALEIGWPADPKGYNGPEIPRDDDEMPADEMSLVDDVPMPIA